MFTACGGSFSNFSGTLSSPSYPDPYPELTDCVYLISQPDGTYVNILFINMDINCQGRSSDYIEMLDGNSEDSPLMGRFCGNCSNVPDFMQTTQNHLRIRWKRNHLDKKWFLPFVNFSFSDSSPTTLRAALDFSLNMNPQMCPTGPITLVHVEVPSQPQMGSSPHHPTQATTQTMQTASTPSLSPLALSSC